MNSGASLDLSIVDPGDGKDVRYGRPIAATYRSTYKDGVTGTNHEKHVLFAYLSGPSGSRN